MSFCYQLPEHFPGPCSASQSYSRLKSLIKRKTEKHEGGTFPESITTLCTERNASSWRPAWLWPSWSAPVHSLPVVAGCPNRTISTAPRNTTQLEVDWGCLCHRTPKELGLSCMGRKWASCYGNTVGGVGADIPSSRTFCPSALPTPGSISC